MFAGNLIYTEGFNQTYLLMISDQFFFISSNCDFHYT